MSLLLSLLLTGCESETGVNAVKESTPPPPPPPDGDAIDIPPAELAKICKPLGPESDVYNLDLGAPDPDYVAIRTVYQKKYEASVTNSFGGSIEKFENGQVPFYVFVEQEFVEQIGNISQFFILPDNPMISDNLKNWSENSLTIDPILGMIMIPNPNNSLYDGLVCTTYGMPANDDTTQSQTTLKYFAGDIAKTNGVQININEDDISAKGIDRTIVLANYGNTGFVALSDDANLHATYQDGYNGAVLTNTFAIFNDVSNNISDLSKTLAIYPDASNKLLYGAYYCTPTDGTPESGCHEIQ